MTQFKVHFNNAQPANWIQNYQSFIPNDITDYQNELAQWIKNILVDPMFKPSQSGQKVELIDDSTGQSQQISADDLVNAILEDNLNPNLDNDDRSQLTEVFQKAAQFVDTSKLYTYEKQLTTDVLRSTKNPLPNSNIRYTFNVDILPSSKTLLGNFTSQQERTQFMSSWSGYFYNHPLQNQLNVTVFKSYNEQKDFQDYLAQELRQHPTGDTQLDNKIAQATQSKVSSDFTTTWLLGDGKYLTNEVSINKYIMKVLHEYLSQHPDKGFTVPTSIKQTMVPTSFCLVNLQNLSQQDHMEFVNELNVITKGVNYMHRFDFADMKTLATAASVTKSMKKEHTAKHANNHTSKDRNVSQRRSFSRKNLKIHRQIKMVKTLLNHCVSTMPSSNTYRTRHSTFMRGNRRRPDDINLPGQVTKTAYRPDIAIYLDTSGSISEAEYRNAVTLLIQLTQALDTNLYFTSFSHYVAQPVKLKTKHNSAKNIYRQIQSLNKAGGGTNYENVWELIDKMSSYTRKHHQANQLNFIITDFEYDLSSSFIPQVNAASMKSTYYLPMRETSESDQNYLINSATNFASEMMHAGFPGIYKHMLL